jgi:PAS domain-containing protein
MGTDTDRRSGTTPMNGNTQTLHDDGTRATTTVLCVDDDPDLLSMIERSLGARDAFEVRVETDPSAVRGHLDDVDCLVSGYDLGECDGATLLESVRDVAPELPVVLHSSVPLEGISDGPLADPWTDFLERAGNGPRTDLLGHRIHDLVDRQTLETTARRCRAALETSREATLIVAPDGTVTFVNSQLASELSASPDELQGRRWTELLTDGSVDRLRTEAFPVAADGWSWTGPTTLATDGDGDEERRTSLSRLDDGSTVLVFHETTDN